MNDDPAAFPVEEHQRLAAGARAAAVAVGNILQDWIDLRSVLDLGCGTGAWLRVLSSGGRREVFGVEGEAYRRRDLEIDPGLVLTADLGQAINLHRWFDLVLCLEVAEHIDAARADTVVANCVRHGDLVLFSAALPGQQGIHHVNEQPPQYWAERFARHGYGVLDVIRSRIWNDPQIPVWYRQNILLYVREGSAAQQTLRAALGSAVPAAPLALAHPDLLHWMSAEMQHARVRADAAEHELQEARVHLAAASAEVTRYSIATQEAPSAAEAAQAALTQLRESVERELREPRANVATASTEVERHSKAADEARAAVEAAQEALARLRTSEQQARDAQDAALLARDEAVRARVAAETARKEAVGHTATARQAHAEAVAAWTEVSARLAAQTKAREATERALADSLRVHADEVEVRRIMEAQLGDAQRRLAIDIATLATMRADITRVRGEAALAIDTARAKAHQQAQNEATAQLASETALREAKRAIATEAEARRQVESRIYTLSQDLMLARNQVATLAWEKHVIRGSALWRVMQPVRAIGRRIPFSLRLRLRRAIGAAETKDFAMPAVQAVPPPAPAARSTGDVRFAATPKVAGLEAPGLATPGLIAPSLAALERDAAAPRLLRIVFVSGEPDNPGHVYRVQRYVEAARALGADAMWFPLREVIPHGEDIARASVMVIWRAANGPEVAHALWVAHSHGVKVLFDVDDLMFDPSLATRKMIDGIRSQDLTESDVAHHFQRVREVAIQADACTTTTEELARHLRAMDRITFVLPNLFDLPTWCSSRLAVRRRVPAQDGLLRIGYAAGTRTHQRDFREAATAVARLLRERPQCRLVLFRDPDTGRPLFDPDEYPALAQRAAQIEWRDRVSLRELPNELARFDINLAPLEIGNAFCEAKSELKYFEAALVEVCTIASPTGPLRRAIRDGVTGHLADTEEEWYRALCELADDVTRRQDLAHAAYLDTLARFGPHEGPVGLYGVLQHLVGVEESSRAFELDFLRRRGAAPPAFDIPRATVEFHADQFGEADVTVVIPLYNYAHYIEEALESVRQQTIPRPDLVVVDDASTDTSLQVAVGWAQRHASRFNRILVVRNETNSGLGRARNTGFDAAETPFVLPLDADNRLRPDCCATLLDALRDSRAGFAYSILQCFGAAEHVIGTEPFAPMRFASSNYIDAMALVAKWCWAKVGGYTHIDHGWEDYDFWCKCVEHGLWGQHVREILAEYRVHESSMLRTATDRPDNKRKVIRQLEDRHDWLTIDYRP